MGSESVVEMDFLKAIILLVDIEVSGGESQLGKLILVAVDVHLLLLNFS